MSKLIGWLGVVFGLLVAPPQFSARKRGIYNGTKYKPDNKWSNIVLYNTNKRLAQGVLW